MTKTSECELQKLGEDAPTHEELKMLIDEEFKRMPMFGCGQSKFTNMVAVDIAYNNKNYLEELIRLRAKHSLPNDGRCYQCPGNRCSVQSMKIGGEL